MKKSKSGRKLSCGSAEHLNEVAEAYFKEFRSLLRPLTVEMFCLRANLERNVFYNYCKRDDDVGKVARRISMQITADRIEGGLLGRQNPLLVKFLLTNNDKMNYQEKQSVEHSADTSLSELIKQLDGKAKPI